MQSQMCEEGKHNQCEIVMQLGRAKKVCDCECHGIFKSPSEFLTAITKLSKRQKERLLLDLAWKCWDKPKGTTYKQVAISAYKITRLVP